MYWQKIVKTCVRRMDEQHIDEILVCKEKVSEKNVSEMFSLPLNNERNVLKKLQN